MYGESDPEPGIRQPGEQTARLADTHGPGQRASFSAHGCTQRGTKRLSLRQSAG